jgi:PLP dependent protein
MNPSEVEEVAERSAQLEHEIAEACRAAGRPRESVRLVAVSKRQPPERWAAAFDAGHRVFGENYPREMAEKAASHPEASWHLVGRLQRNKVKLMEHAALIHSVDSERLGTALDRFFAAVGRRQPILIQVHQGDEESKGGVLPGAVEPLVRSLTSLPNLDVRGLMTIPPPSQGPRYFAELRELRDQVEARSGHRLPELSMGMSADFPDAIREGATWIRVGTRLFGPRPDSAGTT